MAVFANNGDRDRPAACNAPRPLFHSPHGGWVIGSSANANPNPNSDPNPHPNPNPYADPVAGPRAGANDDQFRPVGWRRSGESW
jgi:hypothetical protein